MDASTSNASIAIVDIPSLILPLALTSTSSSHSPLFYSVATFFAAIATLLGIALWRPRVNSKSPPFTSDTIPIIGSLGFLIRQWSFWRASTKGLTQPFSFWLGSRHIVGITGEATRKMFYTHPDLCFVSQAIIQPFGVHFWNREPIHPIFRNGPSTTSTDTFFLKRLAECMRTPQLRRVMPKCQSDARKDLESIIGDQASGIVSSPDVWKTIFKQNARLKFNDEVVEDAALFEECSGAVDVLLHTYSAFNAMFPWLPEPAWIRRRLARRHLVRLVRKMVAQRIRENGKNPVRPDDPLQRLLDNGDPYESIVEFFVSSLFISTTNAHAIAGQMLNIMAVHPDWQRKIYDELREAIDSTKAKFVGGTMVDQLDRLPLEAWESKLPTMALCVRETIRMWTSFSVTRLNTSNQEISIPDTQYVIPPKTFVIYNSTEVNFSEKLYPNPTEYDPSRFLEGREEFKREHFGFLGWGQGQHACVGTRWAKLQQHMIVAYAVAMYKWTSCLADGTPDPFIKHRRYLDSDSAFKLPPAYAKLERRDYIN